VKRFRNAFIAGLLILVPVFATLDIFRWLISTLDRMTRSYLPEIPPFNFPGFGILVAIVIVTWVGIAAQNYLGKALVRFLDRVIEKTPLIGGLYSTIKQFLETLFQQGNDQFSGVVLVEFPRTGMYSVGFRTGKPNSVFQEAVGKNLVNVFVPCAPNPTAGFYLLVEEKDLLEIKMSVQEAFKIVLSMGIVSQKPKTA